MKMHRVPGSFCGFTLVEVMVAMSISVVLLGALIETSIVLQRNFVEAENTSAAISDEERILDYMSRDLREAYTVNCASGTLTLTIPQYYSSYDAQGNPSGPPVTPVISGSVVNYGNAATPITVVYYLNGQQLIRQQTLGSTGAFASLVISNDVINLQSSYADLTSIVTLQLSFAPQFNLTSAPGAGATIGETINASVSVRNVRKD